MTRFQARENYLYLNRFQIEYDHYTQRENFASFEEYVDLAEMNENKNPVISDFTPEQKEALSDLIDDENAEDRYLLDLWLKGSGVTVVEFTGLSRFRILRDGTVQISRSWRL